ncbi:hypothetical protein PG994_010955 [Apiospora phragmitis]|uniref:DUF7730 domain-containing protein n=1 Tax=Apiospora phragmitis TaxID=2905665 RepID=A0ABR1TRD8_9PEZI
MQAFKILVALFLAIMSVVADSSSGNFTSNCPIWFLSDSGTQLTAKCNNDDWMPTCSQLDLNQNKTTDRTGGRCFENKDGALNWAASGKAFSNGCSSCKLTGYASIQCSCLSSDGNSRVNSVKDLSNCHTTLCWIIPLIPLFKLPLEVRLMIYEFAVQVDDTIRPRQVAEGSNKFICRARQKPSKNLTVTDLARTCRMVYHELEDIPVFYRISSFQFHRVLELHYFLAAITPARRGSIREITIEQRHPPHQGPYGRAKFTKAGNYSRVMPLLHKCYDLRRLILQMETHPYTYSGRPDTIGYVRGGTSRETYPFLSMPGLRIVLKCNVPFHQIAGIQQVQEVVIIGPDWDGTAIQGSLAEPVRLALGTDITKIGEVMASIMVPSNRHGEAIEVTDEQLKNSIAAAGIHFPGEDRVHLTRLGSDFGTVSSRTRHRCNTANFDASDGRIGRTIGEHDAEGLLTEDFIIHDIRSIGSSIECEIVYYDDARSWEPLHTVATNRGIYQLEELYQTKLRLAAKDGRVMQNLPAPRDITLVTDAYREGPKTKTNELIWRTYRRTWAKLQEKFETRMRDLTIDDGEETEVQQEQENSKKTSKQKRKKTKKGTKATSRGRGKK